MFGSIQEMFSNYQFQYMHLLILAAILIALWFVYSYFRRGSSQMMPGYPPQLMGPQGPHGPQGPGPQGVPGPVDYPSGPDANAAPVSQQRGGMSNKTLVLYYAPWCTYCKKLMPVWDSLSEKYGERMQKVDCEANADESVKQEIEVFPTIVLFNADGKKEQVIKGVSDAESLERLLA
jgi:thioredoxin 1